MSHEIPSQRNIFCFSKPFCLLILESSWYGVLQLLIICFNPILLFLFIIFICSLFSVWFRNLSHSAEFGFLKEKRLSKLHLKKILIILLVYRILVTFVSLRRHYDDFEEQSSGLRHPYYSEHSKPLVIVADSRPLILNLKLRAVHLPPDNTKFSFIGTFHPLG